MRTMILTGALAAGALAVVVGSASTSSNTIQASVAGYGSSTISGATATSVTYTLDDDGTQITGADMVFQGNQSGRTVRAGFGTDTLATCTVGVYDATNLVTPVACDGLFTQPTATSASFNVAVS
jgi:hypothetical protein